MISICAGQWTCKGSIERGDIHDGDRSSCTRLSGRCALVPALVAPKINPDLLSLARVPPPYLVHGHVTQYVNICIPSVRGMMGHRTGPTPPSFHSRPVRLRRGNHTRTRVYARAVHICTARAASPPLIDHPRSFQIIRKQFQAFKRFNKLVCFSFNFVFLGNMRGSPIDYIY